MYFKSLPVRYIDRTEKGPMKRQGVIFARPLPHKKPSDRRNYVRLCVILLANQTQLDCGYDRYNENRHPLVSFTEIPIVRQKFRAFFLARNKAFSVIT